ncbi:hypothetical protein M422DRAFT_260413 [Sphaerobolus stellatus SS14]|uniref:Uncharacterized protein n=1 Tax=Sphaerobolus stellatus (strain SS14) TaxID=990650 RepID=A0A0C9VHK9_SPHS4|nr:hypothetical protein M422DRAFT_260413 [Sphaerobolus stellatus SS14]
MSESDIRNFHESKEPYPLAVSHSFCSIERVVLSDSSRMGKVSAYFLLDDIHNGNFGSWIREWGVVSVTPSSLFAAFGATATHQKIATQERSGSCTKAIQAANTHPDAEVIAIDISSLPPRETHCIFATRGWLLVDEAESDVKGNIGPNITKVYEIYNSFTGPDVEPLVDSPIEPVLKESGSFSEVNVRKVNTPFSDVHEDPAVANLGEIIKASFFGAYKVLDPRLVEFGLTKEIQDGWHTKVNDPERNLSFNIDIYFTWSRKSQ